MPPIQVDIPRDIIIKMEAWQFWHSFWNWLHYGLGFLSAMLSATVAANTKAPFLSQNYSVGIAAIAAGLTFLLTSLGSSAKAAGFETAAREVEKAIALYQAGQSQSKLYDAVARGIDILNKLK